MKTVAKILLFSICALVSPSVMAQNFKTLTPLWSLQPGDRPYLTSTSGTGQPDNLQRGMAYNPATDHVLIVSRVTSPVLQGIYILDANNGGDIGSLNINGITNGTFILSKINVADDGVIYAANFGSFNPANESSFFKIYRWADENAEPTVAFMGDPSNGTTNLQWGTTLDVRGSGVNTEILLGSNGKVASLLTTIDGVNFTAEALVTDAPDAGDFEHGIAFGSGDSFWSKAIGRDLRRLTFNGGVATTVSSFDTNTLVSTDSLGQLAVDPGNQLLAFLETPPNPFISATAVLPRQNRVRLYDISNPSIPPVLLDIKDFPVNIVNRNAAGQLDFGNGKFFALGCNNGIMAFSVDPVGSVAPEIVTSEISKRVMASSSVHLSVTAKYATNYQWRLGGTDLPDATNATLEISGILLSQGGQYSVVISNATGSVSADGHLTVADPDAFPNFTLMWSHSVPSADPLITVNANAQIPYNRSLAYHSVSNQVIYINRTSPTAGLTVNVLDADSGAFLYRLNTTGISGGAIILLMIVASEDGSVYAANMQADARTGAVQWKLYRWATTDPELSPVLIFQGEPADLSSPLPATRWGDTMDIRGTGADTQIIIDGWNQEYGSLLWPNGDDLNSTWNHRGFLQGYVGGSLGRSIHFGTNTSAITYWQKRKAEPLLFSTLDIDAQTSTTNAVYDFLPDDTSFVGMDLENGLIATVHFAPDSSLPDLFNIYEVSDFSQPLLLHSEPLPVTPTGNAHSIGQIVFSENSVFVTDANNGMMALRIQTGGVTTPPIIFTEPQDDLWWIGEEGLLSVTAADVESYQWQHGDGTTFTNLVGETTNTLFFANVQLANAGAYRVVLSNAHGTTISSNGIATVISRDDYYSLSEIWNAAPGTQPFVTSTGGNGTPNERTIAYNSLSNQLYVVQRDGTGTAIGTYNIYVLNPANGAVLYTLNTNGIPLDGTAPGGSSFLALNAIAVADDGAIYISALAPDACSCTTANGFFRLYRWADSHPDTLPVEVFVGDPAGATISRRWGDTMSVRGSGVNTEIVLDTLQGTHAAVLRPTDSSMNTFTNTPLATTATASIPIGRSLEFATGDSIWQKRAGGHLILSSYDLANQTTMVISNHSGFPATTAGITIDQARNLAAVVDMSGGTGISPDTVNLYDISDLSAPLLLGQYNFPEPKRNNMNLISQTIFAGNKVFSLNGNNGLVAFELIAPGQTAPVLQVEKSGSNVILSWSDSSAILQAASSLVPPITWDDISALGETNAVRDASAGTRFYRLKR